jgi:high-affinity Fe2+/Pb2+ permease
MLFGYSNTQVYYSGALVVLIVVLVVILIFVIFHVIGRRNEELESKKNELKWKSPT